MFKLQAFGQLDRIEETAVDKMVLTFPSRKAAEIAAIQGAEFHGKTLVLAWFTGHLKSSLGSDGPQIQRRVTRSLSQSLMEKDLDDELVSTLKKNNFLLWSSYDFIFLEIAFLCSVKGSFIAENFCIASPFI